MTESYISPSSTCSEKCRTLVCFIAGILTYRNNFEDAANEIAKRFRHAKIVMIFPYGLANGKQGSALFRLLTRQLSQAGFDLVRDQSRRVKEASHIIRAHAADVERLILIGHSAGGVIAYRTGLELQEHYGAQQIRVFAVGCPKFYLKDIPYNEGFTYITGQNRDRITQIGSWRKPGSKIYKGKPGREIQLDFNPDHQGWRFHASYFLKSSWADANETFRTNSEELVAKIYELCPDH